MHVKKPALALNALQTAVEAPATCMTGGIRHVSPNRHPWEQVTKAVVLWGVLSAGISPWERCSYKKKEGKTLRSTSTDQRRDRHCGQQLLMKWPRWGCSCLYLTDQKDYDQKGTMEKMLMEGHQFAGKTGTSFRCRMLPRVQEPRSPTPCGSSRWVPARRSTTSCLPFLLLAVLPSAPSGPCTPTNIEQGKGTKGLKPFQQQLCWIKAWKMFLLRSV